GRGGDAGFTVQAACKDARDGGLADTARAGEEVGMVQAAIVQGVDEGLEHMPLPGHLLEVAGAPLACKYLVTHLPVSEVGVDAPHRAWNSGAVSGPLDRNKGGTSCQPHPGTCRSCYRCSLPGLAGFTTWHCGGTGKRYHYSRAAGGPASGNGMVYVRDRYGNRQPAPGRGIIRKPPCEIK